MRNADKILVGKLKGKYYSGYVGVDGKKILKYILKT
jgi:hypothetical protein